MGFPESELAILFDFFVTSMNGKSRLLRGTDGPTTALSKNAGIPRSRREMRETTHGAEWIAAVACLRLLARPKESVMKSLLAVFEVFARARGDRVRHRRRQELQVSGIEIERPHT